MVCTLVKMLTIIQESFQNVGLTSDVLVLSNVLVFVKCVGIYQMFCMYIFQWRRQI